MTHRYPLRGVCARSVTFDIENGIVSGIRFEGGCSGNTQGVAALAERLPVEQVIDRLSGLRCGFKSTSCPDQLARALTQALADAAQ